MGNRSYGQTPTSTGKLQNDNQYSGFNLASRYAKYTNLCKTGAEVAVFFIYQCYRDDDHHVRKSNVNGNKAYEVIAANQQGRAPEGMQLSAVLVHERWTTLYDSLSVLTRDENDEKTTRGMVRKKSTRLSATLRRKAKNPNTESSQ